ncbi:MAG: hypothetical protein HOO91_15435 [Bacteroidales bacterium]|nr:hypothetical protein [Bacteroidales bacterium]
MKELKELKGVKLLTKKEQKSVVGGLGCIGSTCPPGSFCCTKKTQEFYGVCRQYGQSCF